MEPLSSLSIPKQCRSSEGPWALNCKELWEIEAREIHRHERIGAGATAEVYRATWHGTDVAVKVLKSEDPLPDEFSRELTMLLRLRHPNLVLFMGASLVERMLVSEYCAGGSLFQLLYTALDINLSWAQRHKMGNDVAKGMGFLHGRGVVHRDLKSLNLLLSASPRGSQPFNIKIADFGVSRFVPAPAAVDAAAHMTRGVGTYHWMAPEVIEGGGYDAKADVYSFGVCLYEIFTRRTPFHGSGLTPVAIAVAVTRGQRPDLALMPEDCPAGLRELMVKCWDSSPTNRPDFSSVLEVLKTEEPTC